MNKITVRSGVLGKDGMFFRTVEMDDNFVLNDGEALLKIKMVGICGSDIGFVKNKYNSNMGPVILGHEFVAEIVELKVSIYTGFKVGDRVIGDAGVGCGKCKCCLDGDANLCETTKFYGFPPFDGAFKDYLIFPIKALTIVPSGMSDIGGVLTEPLAVCVHAVGISEFKVGQRAAVIGCGPIGLLTIKLLKDAGAEKVIAIEPINYRRKVAIDFGADEIYDSGNVFNKESNLFLDNNRVDVVFDASDTNSGVNISTKIIRPGGSIILIGIPDEDNFINISHVDARKKGLTIKMVRRFKDELSEAIKLLSNDLSWERVVTHVLPIEEIGEAFKKSINHLDGCLKVVISF